MTFRRDILKKNRAMIVTENVWTNIKKKGLSLLGKVRPTTIIPNTLFTWFSSFYHRTGSILPQVKKLAVEHLGSPTNSKGGVSSFEGGGNIRLLQPAPGALGTPPLRRKKAAQPEPEPFYSPTKDPPPLDTKPVKGYTTYRAFYLLCDTRICCLLTMCCGVVGQVFGST